MHSIDELNQLYQQADMVDHDLFAEMRSNTLLVSGFHYAKLKSSIWDRIRGNKNIPDEQKLRLTKNHIYRICKIYVNNIWRFSPSVTIGPNNPSELQDQKAAEMHQAIWKDIKKKVKANQKALEFLEDFITIGECISKITFDPEGGKQIGFEPILDKNGEMIDKKPAFEGMFHEEHISAFDLRRDPSALSFDEARWVCHANLQYLKELKQQYKDSEEKLKYVVESGKDSFRTFDTATGSYQDTKGMVLVKEYYFRPSKQYPKGYFYITTDAGILEEGQLPAGVFPLTFGCFDRISKSPRGRSIIKQLRPFQAEINRTGSKIAETQIIFGDTKILIQSGTKISHGGLTNGLRATTYTGQPPIVVQGQGGEQYVNYMNSQISEMYQIAMVEEDSQQQQTVSDPYTILYQSMKQKKTFSVPAERYQEFLMERCKIFLALAKYYYRPETIVFAAGKSERVNIEEFKSAEDIGYQITPEPSNDDVESKMGRQLVLNHVLQYVGPNLPPDQIGLVVKAMPFANEELLQNTLTIDHDNAVNEILAIDRGKYPNTDPEENHEFTLKALSSRVKKPDYEFLAPQIKQAYQQKMAEHRQFLTQQQQAAQAAQAGYIPSGGALVGVDLYGPKPGSPGKTSRLQLPSEAVTWLVDKLSAQGSSQQTFDNLPLSQQAAMAAEMGAQQVIPPLEQGIPPEMIANAEMLPQGVAV